MEKTEHILISIPTKNRTKELSRLLASLSAQVYTDFSVMIINESDVINPFEDDEVKFWMDALSRHHKVIQLEGHRINQCYAHNMALYSDDAPELILRLDDDLVLDADFIYNLVSSWFKLEEDGERPGAIGGIYFDDRNPRDEREPISTIAAYTTGVERSGLAYAVAQMVDYIDDDLIPAEHIYSACLYSRDAMIQVGGWPYVYSEGVAHREETDGTYRLFLAGYSLWIDPSAKAKHEHAPGGIRTLTAGELAARRDADESLWQRRIGRLRGANYRPTVCVVSSHTDGIGGAQRLFYSTVSALRQSKFFSLVHMESFGGSELMGRDDVLDIYGVDIGPGQPELGADHYDVSISIGHEPPGFDDRPRARHHIHYNLFPTTDHGMPKGVSRMVSISEYSAKAAEMIYRRRPEVVYPFVDFEQIEPSKVQKENWIVAVGDVSRGKSLGSLAEAFLQFDLPDDTVLHIVVPSEEDTDEFSYLESVSRSPAIELHVGLSATEIGNLYEGAKILWAARGYGHSSRSQAKNYEHFGYTPVEALGRYCVPLTFDAGGYTETANLRWRNMEELEAATKKMLEEKDSWTRVLKAGLDGLHKFSRNRFLRDWERIALSTNAFAWESKYCEWRKPGTVEVRDEKHIACISESPYNPTGYGVIAKQVYQEFIDAGYKVHVLALNDHQADRDGLYHRWTPHPRGFESPEVFRDFVRSERFDAFFVSRDVYTGSKFINAIRGYHMNAPVISLVSQEGSPAKNEWQDVLDHSDRVLTYSSSASDVVAARFGGKIDWAYLGANHANFRPYSESERTAARAMVGWSGKFVILCVTTNKFYKQIPTLMRAVEILKYTIPNVILVLHTKVVGESAFGGYNLASWVEQLEIEDNIAFSPKLNLPMELDVDEILSRAVPRSTREQKEWYESIDMVTLYNMADLYVDVSGAEGFGIPSLEAMACGLPVISVRDGLVRSEILSGCDNVKLAPPCAQVGWSDGMIVNVVDPTYLSELIKTAHETKFDPKKSVEHASQFKWAGVRQKVLEAVESCRR